MLLYILSYIGPLISQAEAWKAEALIGYSVVKTSVCVCVCVFAGHRSQFLT